MTRQDAGSDSFPLSLSSLLTTNDCSVHQMLPLERKPRLFRFLTPAHCFPNQSIPSLKSHTGITSSMVRFTDFFTEVTFSLDLDFFDSLCYLKIHTILLFEGTILEYFVAKSIYRQEWVITAI